MNYKIIDRETYYRKGVYRHFTEDCKCSTSMTARIDVTELVKYVAEQQSMRIKTSVLNELIRDAVSINPPPMHRGRRLKILFMTQADIKPPKFIIFVNDPELMHFSYLRFIENRLREMYGFEGTPLRLIVRARDEEEDY